MRIYFIRNTHDEQGKFKTEFLNIPNRFGENTVTLGVHGLNRSGERTTLEEFYEEHIKYSNDMKGDPYSECEVPDVIDMLKELAELIELKLVKVEIVND